MRRGEYTGLFTNTEVNNYISINEPVNQWNEKLLSLYFCTVFWYLQTKSEDDNCFVLAWQFLLLLWNLITRRIMFISKILYWKTLKPNLVAFFLLIGMAFSFIYFRKPERHVVISVCSHASQEYPRIFLNKEPIRAREKHYSLVWYMLMKDILSSREAARCIFSLGTDTEGNNCFSICQNIEMKQEINFYVTLKQRELLNNETNERAPSRLSAPRWVVQDSRRRVLFTSLANTNFGYLGRTFSRKGSLDAEISRRIAKANTAFGKLEKRVWLDRNITTNTKLSFYEAYGLTGLLYGSKTRAIYRHQC